MIKSMTGFGRSGYSDGKRDIVVEMRSVNNRYSDITVRMPKNYSFLQEQVKNCIKEKVKRGKVEVSVFIENLGEEDMCVHLNGALAEQYYRSLHRLKEQFGLAGEVTLELLASMPEVLKVQADTAEEEEEEIAEAILLPVREAADNLDEMRRTEGEKLAEDLLLRAELIRRLTAQIAERTEQVPKEHTLRLRDRIREMIGDEVEVSEDRILAEAAIFADKCNITEELIRLKSHVLQLKQIITESCGPEGKKLDFLVQEMNREANTIGSKANDMEITNVMLQIKAEVEKIREQVQNIE